MTYVRRGYKKRAAIKGLLSFETILGTEEISAVYSTIHETGNGSGNRKHLPDNGRFDQSTDVNEYQTPNGGGLS
ncbi:hypothetical protein [Megasphaera sueciensis]|uniref:hypothetical protein n=1 Tax=Megasphaera sueciensis TaxID=349094 RepID=UPI003CFD73D8